jgi:hypothetical protein
MPVGFVETKRTNHRKSLANVVHASDYSTALNRPIRPRVPQRIHALAPEMCRSSRNTAPRRNCSYWTKRLAACLHYCSRHPPEFENEIGKSSLEFQPTKSEPEFFNPL